MTGDRTQHHIDVLLVEDDEVHGMLIERAIRETGEGVHVHRAGTGREALDLLAERMPDDGPRLMLLDLKLPGMTGLEVLRRVKADDRWSALPIVVLTTSPSDHDRAEAFRLHANAYVLKPDSLDGFRRVMGLVVGFWVGCNLPPSAAVVA